MRNKHKIPRSKKAVQHIVVHCTGTRRDLKITDLDKLPYHFLITANGKLLNLKPVAQADTSVEVAWLGGINRFGQHTDNRTGAQEETLFNTLVLLAERFPGASIVGANELYVYGYDNPGFNLKEWLQDYIPAFLQAA